MTGSTNKQRPTFSEPIIVSPMACVSRKGMIPLNVLAENSLLFTNIVPVDSVISDVGQPVGPISLLRVSSVRFEGGFVWPENAQNMNQITRPPVITATIPYRT